MLSPFLRYTILRLLAFFGVLLLLAAIPWMRENLLVMVLVAATVSMVISLFFFNGPRDEMSEKLAARIEHRVKTTQAAHARGHGRPTAEESEDAEIPHGVGEQEHYR